MTSLAALLWSPDGADGVFDCRPMVDWTRGNAYVPPAAAVVAYLLMVFAGGSGLRRLGAALGPNTVRHLSAVWNMGLCIFSVAGVAAALPFTVDMLTGEGKGLRYALCSDDMMFGPASTFGVPDSWRADATAAEGVEAGAACYGGIGLMMTLFMLSKGPELMDTVFLMLKGKPVGVLQWWHHSSVLAISWYAYVIAAPSSVMFATMNYMVHSIMYGEFLRMPIYNVLYEILAMFHLPHKPQPIAHSLHHTTQQACRPSFAVATPVSLGIKHAAIFSLQTCGQCLFHWTHGCCCCVRRR